MIPDTCAYALKLYVKKSPFPGDATWDCASPVNRALLIADSGRVSVAAVPNRLGFLD